MKWRKKKHTERQKKENKEAKQTFKKGENVELEK